MNYVMHCGICNEDDEWEIEEDEIDNIEYENTNVISMDNENKTAKYICSNCEYVIKKFIPEQRDYRHDHQSQIEQIRREVNSLNSIIQGNMAGVQNVYNEFRKISDEGFISGFNQIVYEYKLEFSKMRKELNELRDFVKKGLKSIGAVNDLYRLSKENPELIVKLAKIVNMLGEKDDEF